MSRRKKKICNTAAIFVPGSRSFRSLNSWKGVKKIKNKGLRGCRRRLIEEGVKGGGRKIREQWISETK